MSIGENTVTDILGEGGLFQQKLDNYEHRDGQIQMSEAIADAFNNQKHLIVEADTGTGKSFAYLIPSILWSTQNGERVVISTNTINLQDQLINNDIPQLTEMLESPVQSSVLKGRSNYLCPRRLSTVRTRQPNSVDELRTIAKILVWLLENY